MSKRVEIDDYTLDAVTGGMLFFEKLDDGTPVIRRRDGSFNIVGTWVVDESVIAFNDLAEKNKATYDGDVNTLKRYLDAKYIKYIGVK